MVLTGMGSVLCALETPGREPGLAPILRAVRGETPWLDLCLLLSPARLGGTITNPASATSGDEEGDCFLWQSEVSIRPSSSLRPDSSSLLGGVLGMMPWVTAGLGGRHPSSLPPSGLGRSGTALAAAGAGGVGAACGGVGGERKG